MNAREVFHADLERANRHIQACDAVITTDDDGWQGVDPGKVTRSFLDYYSKLIQYGYANGLLP